MSLSDPGQEDAEHRRRAQTRRRVEVEVQRRTGDHRERELRVREPEIARLALDTDWNMSTEPREPTRGHAREVPSCRQPDALDPVGALPFEHHALGERRVAQADERIHHTQILVLPPPRGTPG
jgi:hypothetical protein